MNGPPRCPWAESGGRGTRQLMLEYHDLEWGVPLHDDVRLFEMLILEGAQAGLSWSTVLGRREGYRRAFDGFDAEKVARYGDADRARLLADPGIIRNRAKIDAAIRNARAFLAVRDEHGSFDRFLWGRLDGVPRRNRFRRQDQLPAQTEDSRDLSRALSDLGFSFVGPTIAYAFMQAIGMVNDHLVGCFRHDEI